VELQTDTADAAYVMLTVDSTMCEKYGLNCTNGTAALSIIGNHTIATYQKVIIVTK